MNRFVQQRQDTSEIWLVSTGNESPPFPSPNIPRGSGGVKPPAASQKRYPNHPIPTASPKAPPSPLRGGGMGRGAPQAQRSAP
jgi:hypothetical protein